MDEKIEKKCVECLGQFQWVKGARAYGVFITAAEQVKSQIAKVCEKKVEWSVK